MTTTNSFNNYYELDTEEMLNALRIEMDWLLLKNMPQLYIM